MPTFFQRHLLAASVALTTIVFLSAAVYANGFRDFTDALWLFDAATVAMLAYALVILVARARSFMENVWRRAALFGAIAGAILASLAFVRLATLNASGIAVAVVLTVALGVVLGLTAVEGLRWVRHGSCAPDA